MAAAGDVKPDVKPGSEFVTIKVKSADGATLTFKVKAKTMFTKVATAYADKKGHTLESLVFMFDGERLAYEGSTVSDLGLKDGDIVDVTVPQVGGSF